MAVDYREEARKAAAKHGVPPELFLAQIQQESGFNPNARSPAGAIGIAQIVPRWHPKANPTDPIAALDYAAGHMSRLYKQYGNWKDPLAVYNSGRPWAKSQGFTETRNYVNKIMAASGGGTAISDVTATPVSTLDQKLATPQTMSLDMKLLTPYLQRESQMIQRGQAPKLGDLLRVMQRAQSMSGGSASGAPGSSVQAGRGGAGDTVRGGAKLVSTFGHTYQLPVLDKRFVIPGGVSTIKTPRGQQVAIAQFDGKPVSAWMASVLSFARSKGWKGKVNSGYRSQQEQQVLWNRHPDPKWVARPGSSPHQYAQAVDVSDGKGLEAIIARYKIPLGRYAAEGWHFEPLGFRKDAKKFW